MFTIFGPTRFSHYGEVALQRSPHTALTFLRAPFFMENLLGHAELMKRDGVLPVFGAERPMPMISRGLLTYEGRGRTIQGRTELSSILGVLS